MKLPVNDYDELDLFKTDNKLIQGENNEDRRQEDSLVDHQDIDGEINEESQEEGEQDVGPDTHGTTMVTRKIKKWRFVLNDTEELQSGM